MDELTTKQRERTPRLQQLLDSEYAALERERARIQEMYEAYIPNLLTRVQEATGLEQKVIIDLLENATLPYKRMGMKWYWFAEVLCFFLEQKNQEKGNTHES